MAKKIVGGIASVFGKKKKRAAEPAPAPAAESKRWAPIIKQLGGDSASTPAALARARRGFVGGISTILNDKLG